MFEWNMLAMISETHPYNHFGLILLAFKISIAWTHNDDLWFLHLAWSDLWFSMLNSCSIMFLAFFWATLIFGSCKMVEKWERYNWFCNWSWCCKFFKKSQPKLAIFTYCVHYMSSRAHSSAGKGFVLWPQGHEFKSPWDHFLIFCHLFSHFLHKLQQFCSPIKTSHFEMIFCTLII